MEPQLPVIIAADSPQRAVTLERKAVRSPVRDRRDPRNTHEHRVPTVLGQTISKFPGRVSPHRTHRAINIEERAVITHHVRQCPHAQLDPARAGTGDLVGRLHPRQQDAPHPRPFLPGQGKTSAPLRDRTPPRGSFRRHRAGPDSPAPLLHPRSAKAASSCSRAPASRPGRRDRGPTPPRVQATPEAILATRSCLQFPPRAPRAEPPHSLRRPCSVLPASPSPPEVRAAPLVRRRRTRFPCTRFRRATPTGRRLELLPPSTTV